MKTYNDLWGKITTWDNLLSAAYKARQGKKFHEDVSRFFFNLGSELLRLQHELQTQTYQPGLYTTFYVLDPKKRLISAAPFRDRVVHHALCNVIEPVFEKTFIHDSYANRVGKGTHRAIERYQYYARKYPYVLKCDIKKFFPSLDLALLKREIRWKIACPDTLWLIDRIIDNSNPQEAHLAWFPGDDLLTPSERRRGLPIGNLTSQFWANVYLNRFDHFIKETLCVPGYVRYVDDFVLFASTRAELHAQKQALTDYLAGLRLLPHPDKTHIHRTASGVPFLGFRVWPQYRVVQKEKTRRFERHLRARLSKRPPDKAGLEAGLNSWRGHVRFGQYRRLEYRVFWTAAAAGLNIVTHPEGGWRVL
jgi:RNA-directed DNA polymerase